MSNMFKFCNVFNVFKVFNLCEILDVAKAGQLVDQTEQSPKSAFLTARKEQIYARAADRQIGSRVCGSA